MGDGLDSDNDRAAEVAFEAWAEMMNDRNYGCTRREDMDDRLLMQAAVLRCAWYDDEHCLNEHTSP